MTSVKQSKKQTKKEKKARKQEAREAARRAELRRNRITMAIVAVIVLAGGGLATASVVEERREEAEAQAQQEEMMAQLEEEEEAIENRPIACGAGEPESAGEEKPTYEQPPEQVIEDGVDYRAVIETSCGEVVLDLREDAAPETVNAFVFLAEEGFYDGLEIFRIAEGIGALQTGSGTNEASFDIGYTLPDEFELAEEGYPPGSVAMANSGPGTAGSQFFFVYGEQFDKAIDEGTLEATYTRFADVTEGLDVLEEIGEKGAVGELVGGEVPAEIVYMESVRIETD